jgi:hypothetical protein
MEYGIDVEIVPEDYTSQRCSICGVKYKKGRVYRGLYIYAVRLGRRSMQILMQR